jgi:hypothetical protein
MNGGPGDPGTAARRCDHHTPPATDISQVFTTQGVVRGLRFKQSDAASEYARIRLAGDPNFYMDFDEPLEWEDRKGHLVTLSWCWSLSSDGLWYRLILDFFDEGEPS